MAGATVPFACACGKLGGCLHDVAPNRGNHMKCYCTSCQTAARVLGYEHTLDAHGGTEVFQTVPSKIEWDRGQRHLACLRLSPKGMLRWYASCCNTPLFTMFDNASFALAGFNMGWVSEADRPAFGPLAGVYSAKGARNAPPGLRDYGLAKAFGLVFWRAIKARLRGDSGWPFFDDKGQITVTPPAC
jgi:hypothetical protein